MKKAVPDFVKGIHEKKGKARENTRPVLVADFITVGIDHHKEKGDHVPFELAVVPENSLCTGCARGLSLVGGKEGYKPDTDIGDTDNGPDDFFLFDANRAVIT